MQFLATISTIALGLVAAVSADGGNGTNPTNSTIPSNTTVAVDAVPTPKVCYYYYDCKCYDYRTDRQVQPATAQACGKFGRAAYFSNVTHACHDDYQLDSCSWDRQCKNINPYYVQKCWNKDRLPA